MIAPRSGDRHRRAARAGRGGARVIVPFTGAGISTECGIPDFRSPGGTLDQEPADPVRRVPGQPGDARRSLAAALRHGRAVLGGAARAAGISRWRASTAPARRRRDHAEYRQSASSLGHRSRTRDRVARQHHLRPVPRLRQALRAGMGARAIREARRTRARLPDCGGHIKTATISFGQAMPERAMRRAEQLDSDCDLFIAIGSSLVVWPAAGFPLMAKRNGARLIIINREPTEFDEIADLVVREDIGTVLAPFIVH